MKDWWAKGLLFENCSCQLVCPGHIHFDQLCTHERCRGYWAFQFDDGEAASARLAEQRVVIAFDSPRRMIDGGWTQIMFVDEGASRDQRNALESVFRGELGGPWEILGKFVSERLPTRYVPIEMATATATKTVTIPGVLEATVERIRGKDRSEPVTFENIFNQIHSSSQVIAFGDSRYDDGVIRFDTKRTHGLWSQFDWNVSTA
jgi:hypothetical protein